jgi:hypothetical protein
MSLYCWQVHDHDEWNIIAADIGGVMTPLVTTRPNTADRLEAFAQLHHHMTGLPIRLAIYDEPRIEKETP